MPKSKALIDANGEVRELTAADMKRFHPAKKALSKTLLANLKDWLKSHKPTNV